MQVTLQKGEQYLLNRHIKHLLPMKYNNGGAAHFPLSNNAVAALVSKQLV